MNLQEDSGALNHALSQRDRVLRAPAPERVKVDGRSLADLLAFAAEYGTLVHYYNLHDVIDGDWSAFFSADPSIRLALRATLDLPDIENELELLLQALRAAQAPPQRLAHWIALEKILVRLLGMLDMAHPAYAGFGAALGHLAAAAQHPLPAEHARRLAFHLGGGEVAQHLRQGPAQAWFEQLIDLLADLLAAVIDALADSRQTALEQLDTSLHQMHDHPPQSALWTAFAQLFRHAQARLNQFPRHLVTFYHHAVLRQDDRAGRPDQLILSFTAASGIAQADIPRGTPFIAGKDSAGEEIAYALDTALTVDAAAIAALQTLTVARQAGIASAQLLSGAVALAPKPPLIAEPFPIFGANTAGIDGALASSTATLGFAVASPCLALAGGQRIVTLSLSIAPPCPSMLAQLLQQAFMLHYSTATGWAAIAAYSVTPPASAGAPYLLSFTLSPDAAPVAAPGDELPSVRASLLQQGVVLDGVTVYPYAVLSRVMLSALSLTVDVDGLPAAQTAPASGAAATSQPFPLFGSPPVQNAVFAFSAPELFVKQVASFSMAINWTGLPVTSNGFTGYYQAYVIDADGQRIPGGQFSNASFTVGMGVVNPGAWQIDSTWSGYLFQTTPGVPLPAISCMPLAQTVLSPPVAASTPTDYYKPAMSYIGLTLTQPAYAFGDVLYAPNVMAASLQMTSAASACAQQCGQDGGADAPTAQLALLARLCSDTPDGKFKARIQTALQQAVACLDGTALSELKAAIAQGSATPAEKQAWETSLAAALRQAPWAALLQKLLHLKRPPAQGSLHERLAQWLAANGAALGASAPVPTQQAQALMAAGTELLAAWAQARPAPVQAARAIMVSGVLQAQATLATAPGMAPHDCIAQCMADYGPVNFPNQPWLPMAAAVSVSYTATAQAGLSMGPAALAFFQLQPFDQSVQVDWNAGTPVPLLAPVTQAGALAITLSAPVQDISLLFRLAPPASGWPAATPALSWVRWSDTAASWLALTPYSDGTDGLRHSGIVRFVQDGTPDQALLRLQVRLPQGDPSRFPLLAELSTNAASASWIGPGGATGLDTPLAPGSITRAAAPLPGIGGIVQPVASSGGRARATGPAFEMWLAERLRHKDYAIDAWDYASLVLADYPSLWQAAVTPACDGRQLHLPGHVWVVAVPGPQTPDVADPAIPSNDTQMLGQIAAMLADRISPFVALSVTNPPYQRLCVVADLIFTDDDAVPACIGKLNSELMAFLSPWPPQGLGPRPDNYYTAQEVAHFIRHRPYVRGILSFQLLAQGDCTAARPYYTTASAHQLSGKSLPASRLLRRPALDLSAPPAMADGEVA